MQNYLNEHIPGLQSRYQRYKRVQKIFIEIIILNIPSNVHYDFTDVSHILKGSCGPSATNLPMTSTDLSGNHKKIISSHLTEKDTGRTDAFTSTSHCKCFTCIFNIFSNWFDICFVQITVIALSRLFFFHTIFIKKSFTRFISCFKNELFTKKKLVIYHYVRKCEKCYWCLYFIFTWWYLETSET